MLLPSHRATTTFESALSFAETAAVQRLLGRQAELAEANRERLDHERRKLDRFYIYKERAAAEKLAAVKVVYDRLLISDDADDQKILPVWATNLDNAERLVASLAEERDRRIADLAGREQVGVQHELLAVSYVEITPDMRDEIAATGLVLPAELLHRVLGLYHATSVEDLVALGSALEERKIQLQALAQRHPIDESGISLASRLIESLDGADLAPADRARPSRGGDALLPSRGRRQPRPHVAERLRGRPADRRRSAASDRRSAPPVSG